jgi:hypothetical protein
MADKRKILSLGWSATCLHPLPSQMNHGNFSILYLLTTREHRY